ncbi:hypothetical protein DPMN_062684 [Dreissena polymorpha]|uniref:Uncharacterized protein n=1 Tax=Dreissena polymorpha TaxID=45954 RepID=A0A9D4HJH5_DREPO|nr:hypothetical protein DPMN_062684 [Dreissena polymorpha]
MKKTRWILLSNIALFLVNYEALIIACSVIGGLLILALTVCICCCCCCKRDKSAK